MSERTACVCGRKKKKDPIFVGPLITRAAISNGSAGGLEQAGWNRRAGTGGADHGAGKCTAMVVPWSSVLWTEMVPLCMLTACFTMESPRPVPPMFLEWLLSTR